MADGGEGGPPGSAERAGEAAAGAAPPGEPRSAMTKDGLRVEVVSGRITGLYQVGKAVGKGKFSTVYKATRRADGLSVALKRVAIFDIMDDKSREKCLKEIKLVQSLDHDNIIRFLDGFIENNELILVFEYAEAGDLKRQLRKAKERDARFDERVIWKYFSQIADAVAHMHGKRIMHRDLKPANIFLTLNGTVKVGDLGLGRLLSENTIEAHSKVGTPLYMSPEVLRGKGYELKSDIWSLGCILYELAMLRSPFKEEGLNLYGLFAKITEGRYPAVSSVYSDELKSLADRMLRQDPGQRPDIEEVCAIAATMRERTTKARVAATAAPTATNPSSSPAPAAPAASETSASPLPPSTGVMPSRPTSATQGAALRVDVPPTVEFTGVDGSPRVTVPTPMAALGSGPRGGRASVSPTRGVDGREAQGSPHARPRALSGVDVDAAQPATDADDAVGYIAIMEAAAAVARDAGLPDPFPDRPPTSAAPPSISNGHTAGANQRPGTRGRARPESASRRRPAVADAVVAPVALPAGIAMPRAVAQTTGNADDVVAPPRSRLAKQLSAAQPAAPAGIEPAAAPAVLPARAAPVISVRPVMTMASGAVGADDAVTPTAVTSSLPVDGLLQITDSSPEWAAMMVWEWLHTILASQPSQTAAARDLFTALRQVKHHVYLCAAPASSTYAIFVGVLRILASLLQLAAGADGSAAAPARTLQDNVNALERGEMPPFAAAGAALQVISKTCVAATSGFPPLPATITPAAIVAASGVPVVRLLAHTTLWVMHTCGWRGASMLNVADGDGGLDDVAEDIQDDADVDDLITPANGMDTVTDPDDDDSVERAAQFKSPAAAVADGRAEAAAAAEWAREHERVRHRLQAVDRTLMDGAPVSGIAPLLRSSASGWSTRLSSLQRHAAVLHAPQLAPGASAQVAMPARALEKIADSCRAELDAIVRVEARWNGSSTAPAVVTAPGHQTIPELVAQYRAAMEAASDLSARALQLEASVRTLASKSAATDDEVQNVKDAVEERAAEMTSTDRVQNLRRALAQLSRENRSLEMALQVTRSQVMRAQLMAGHSRRAAPTSALRHSRHEEVDDDDDDEHE